LEEEKYIPDKKIPGSGSAINIAVGVLRGAYIILHCCIITGRRALSLTQYTHHAQKPTLSGCCGSWPIAFLHVIFCISVGVCSGSLCVCMCQRLLLASCFNGAKEEKCATDIHVCVRAAAASLSTLLYTHTHQHRARASIFIYDAGCSMRAECKYVPCTLRRAQLLGASIYRRLMIKSGAHSPLVAR
jgi:hypothetical protein